LSLQYPPCTETMPSKRIEKHLRGLLKHCLKCLPGRIGKEGKPWPLEHFTSEMALKDISFHVKAKHKKVKQLVPKLTREHRAYIASKFDKMKFKETLPSPEVFAEHFRVSGYFPL